MRLPGIVALTILFAMTSVSSGTNNTFQPAGFSGNWNVAANWSIGTPTAAHHVIIPSGLTCTVNTSAAVADTIEVAGTATLIIPTGMKLTLDNNDSVDSTINGVVSLTSGVSGGGELIIIAHDHFLSGSGYVTGDDVSCQVRIEQTITLQNELANAGGGIRGGLTITRYDPAGTSNLALFNNYGSVVALDRDTILLASTVVIDDQLDAEWKSIGSGAGGPLLRFDHASTGLVGNFRALECGRMLFNANIATCGEFEYSDGKLDFGNSSTFKYKDYDTSSTCSNPQVGGAGVCANPWIVGPTGDNCGQCGD